MENKFKTLQHIDNKRKCLIVGYIKRVKKTLYKCNLFQTIPCLIDGLCILFYADTDTFEIIDNYSCKNKIAYLE